LLNQHPPGDSGRFNTIRDLFTQHPVNTNIWTASAWCLGILITAYTIAIITYHRKIY
jgi:ABC-2 type transport system permease protein